MKVWPIDPLVRWNLTLEVSEKLPQGLSNLEPKEFFKIKKLLLE